MSLRLHESWLWAGHLDRGEIREVISFSSFRLRRNQRTVGSCCASISAIIKICTIVLHWPGIWQFPVFTSDDFCGGAFQSGDSFNCFQAWKLGRLSAGCQISPFNSKFLRWFDKMSSRTDERYERALCATKSLIEYWTGPYDGAASALWTAPFQQI